MPAAATRSSSAGFGATRHTGAIVSDNLRGGAAPGAIQINEALHERGLVRARAAA
jgi:hypothetical protein